MAQGLSERAHRQVLEAAIKLFGERGIDGTSVDAIAGWSGVSKATIYKHWKNKDALCLEVLMHVHLLDDGPAELDSGDLRSDLEVFLSYEPSAEKAAVVKKLTPHILAYAAKNRAFGAAWKRRVLERARTGLKKLLWRGVERGIFSIDLDEELGVALLLGPMMYGRIFGSRLEPQWLALGAVDSFWKAHAQIPPRPAGVGSLKKDRRSTKRASRHGRR